MSKEKIKQFLETSYKCSSEGFLIDVNWASERINDYQKERNKEIKKTLIEIKTMLVHEKYKTVIDRHGLFNLVKRAMEQTEV